MTLTTIQPVTRDNWRHALTLSVHPAQLRFVADFSPPAAIALAKAYIRPSSLPVAPYGIYVDDTMIGYFNLVYAHGSADTYWIYHFFVDHRYQGHGYGTRALQAIIALLRREHPCCRSVSLTVHPDNVAAQRLYTRAGFVPTGESQDGEPLYRLRL